MNLPSSDRPRANILVVDDAPDTLRLLSDLLVEQGYRVRKALTGQMALTSVRGGPPDLILLDIRLPDISGYEVCEQLKADERACEIPVIFISGLDDAVDKVKAFQVGGSDYITKPLQTEEVVARIEYQLKLRTLQKQLTEQNVQLQQEIRDRQQAEAALRERQNHLSAIINTEPECVKLVAPDGKLLEMNPSGLDMLEVEGADSVIGQSIYPFIAAEHLEAFKALNERVCQGKRDSLEFEFVTCKGNRRWGETHAVPLLDERDGTFLHLAVTRDITGLRQQEEALRLMVEGTASKTGNAFFRSCVSHLAKALQVCYALVTEWGNEEKTKLRTLAFWQGGDFGENFEYELGNTPCDHVLYGKPNYFAANVQARFPGNQKLVQLNAQSYWGAPMIDATGAVLGHLAVLHVEPIDCSPDKEAILKIFAARAGAELERKQAEEVLQHQADKDSLLSSISRQFIDQDLETAIQFALQAMGRFTGCDRSCVFCLLEFYFRLVTGLSDRDQSSDQFE